MSTIESLKKEVERSKLELQQIESRHASKTQANGADVEGAASAQVREKLAQLEAKEAELDRDAEIIATQSEELRKESERLLTERDEVRKQKEQWTKMIEEVKQTKAVLEAKEAELQESQKKLLDLRETHMKDAQKMAEDQKKMHRKAKKIKSREKRLNKLRAQQSYGMQHGGGGVGGGVVQQPPSMAYQVPSSTGSDYAE